MRLFDYLLTRGAKVDLDALAKPADGFTSPVRAFDRVLKHETRVTQSIHKLYMLALDEGDLATGVELQWFIQEQVEEEKSASEVRGSTSLGRRRAHGLADGGTANWPNGINPEFYPQAVNPLLQRLPRDLETGVSLGRRFLTLFGARLVASGAS